MSNSKPLPPFTFDLLCYLNRDQLERFSIVERPLKNLIERYFHSKPYRVFDQLEIRGGSYGLVQDNVRWCPNRDDYSVQQFLAREIYNGNARTYFSFTEMRPYLGPTVRIKQTIIDAAEDSTFNPEHIPQMESIAHLWRDHKIFIWNSKSDGCRIVAQDFLPILNSPTILQCRTLHLNNALFPFKDYKVLYTVKIIETRHYDEDDTDLWLQYWQEFLEQPVAKPIVVFPFLRIENTENLIDRLSKTFSSAVSPNAFKIVLVQDNEPLTEFRGTNIASGEILELKKGIPTEYQDEQFSVYDSYTLERYSV
ncbi:hypothetical protein DdX_17630 [Ditylenchus destructor]|uniref:Uncharacterized protein n=1 Tax=Ditylenchus destructor TaxID=166010 RepID=A0AAD4MMN6_9BILA|nr:hypothetical protein DdX_17630 [Ditylenchus destructor]